MKIDAINYKCLHNSYELTAIQICFTNGEMTPLFETNYSKEQHFELKTIKVNHTRQIKQIGVKTTSGFIDGLRLTDDQGHHVVNVCWNTLIKHEVWSIVEVPAG